MVPKFATVVVARGATTGRFCMFGRDLAMNQTCYALVSTVGHDFWLNCAFGVEVTALVHAAHGSAFDTITTTTMNQAKAVWAGGLLEGKLEAIIAPVFTRVLQLAEECGTLTAVRDALLPKLISGEIRVKAAEAMVEAVA